LAEPLNNAEMLAALPDFKEHLHFKPALTRR
jgi:hypothetical protein